MSSKHQTVNIIPVVLASDNNYFPYAYVTILSILKNAKTSTEYNFNILASDDIQEKYKDSLLNLKNIYPNASFNIIDMGDSFKNVTMNIEHISHPTYYRLLLANLLKDTEKCIYLDCDVIVEQDLSQYYNQDISSYYMAGVKGAVYGLNSKNNEKRFELDEVSEFINAGVTLWNLDKIRKDNLEEKFLKLMEKNYVGQDQDIINVACYKNIKLLPLKFNFMTKYEHIWNECIKLNIYSEDEINEAFKNPVIIHYADKIKPWHNPKILLGYKWWEYAHQSPFFRKTLLQKLFYKQRLSTQKRRIIILGVKITYSKNKSKNILEKFFSAKNEGIHKTITILGIKLKFKNSKKELNLKFENLTNKLEQQNNQLSNKINKIINGKINNLENSLIEKMNNVQTSIENILIPKRTPKVTPRDFDNTTVLLTNYHDNIITIDKCPLCGCDKYILKNKYDLNELKQRWINQYNFLPIPQSYSDKILERRICTKCEINYYNYTIPDTAEFYEKLTEYHKIYSQNKWDYDEALRIVQKHKPKSILDIGAGYGYFLDKVKNAVSICEASEFNPLAINKLLQKGYVVNTKDLSRINKKYDFISAFQVLEHIKEPQIFIEKCLNLLNDNGLLLFVTPNPDSILIKYNPGILELPPHHCIDISKQTYEYIAKQYNLEISEYKEQESTPYDYIAYLKGKFNINVEKSDIEKDFLKEKNNLIGKCHLCLYVKMHRGADGK